MTIEEIRELIEIFNESGVAELELQRGENRLRLRRAGTTQDFVVGTGPLVSAVPAVAGGTLAAVQPSASATPATQAPASTPALSPSASSANQPPDADAGHILVRSPIVGTYYESPAPDAPSFVRVGDSIEPGQVLCIIESMKLMNEIEAEVAGVIASKLVENGRPVEYGEALFAIRPR
jgi:acetyl-CoA carboxylase biotin carboxyl carrier protein